MDAVDGNRQVAFRYPRSQESIWPNIRHFHCRGHCHQKGTGNQARKHSSARDSPPAPAAPTQQPDATYTPSLEASTPCGVTSPGSEATGTPGCASISTPPIPPAALPLSIVFAPEPAPTPPPSLFSTAASVPVCQAEPTAAATAGSYFRPFYYHFVADDTMACSPASSFASDGAGGPTSHPGPGSSPAVLRFDGVADHQAIDIDCAWDLDAVLGGCSQPGERGTLPRCVCELPDC